MKCLLHISYDEQRERFLRRLRPDKQWKFNESDLKTRAEWPRFQAAYGEAIGRTSAEAAPWYVVPATTSGIATGRSLRCSANTSPSLRSDYPTLDGNTTTPSATRAPQHRRDGRPDVRSEHSDSGDHT